MQARHSLPACPNLGWTRRRRCTRRQSLPGSSVHLLHPSRRYLTFRYDNVVDQAPAVGIHHAPRARVDDCLYVPTPMQVGYLFSEGRVALLGQGLRAVVAAMLLELLLLWHPAGHKLKRPLPPRCCCSMAP